MSARKHDARASGGFHRNVTSRGGDDLEACALRGGRMSSYLPTNFSRSAIFAPGASWRAFVLRSRSGRNESGIVVASASIAARVVSILPAVSPRSGAFFQRFTSVTKVMAAAPGFDEEPRSLVRWGHARGGILRENAQRGLLAVRGILERLGDETRPYVRGGLPPQPTHRGAPR